MGSRNKLLFLFFILSLQLISQFYEGDSWAVRGQSYTGDGATNNPVVPPGGWLNNGLDGSCFACHNGKSVVFPTAPDMTSYLMTGHKNAMRMVQTPPPIIELTGPDGNPYAFDQSGNSLDWATNTINIAGFCSDTAFQSAAACAAGGGVWLSGIKTLYYIFGGWTENAPGAVFDGSYTQGTQKTAVSFGECARCHTTGFTMDTTVRGRAPEYFFPGISWTPSRTSGTVNFDPDGGGPAVAGSWPVLSSTGTDEGLEGVECERCHDATAHFTSGTVTRPRGADSTALCLQCHRQDHILPYSGGGLGTNIVPTAYTDNGPLPANEPLYALPTIEVGGKNGYEQRFFDYSTGIEFLNSVHARFGGNFQQIASPAQYNSNFQETLYTCSISLYVSQSSCQSHGGTWSQSTVQGGCTTCHEVHQSTVAGVSAAPFKKQCPDCHADKAGSLMSTIYHPSGAGTPLGDGSQIAGACQTCHMPRPQAGNASATHLWRIKPDSSYRTFPSLAEWTAGQKTAFTLPESYTITTPAVYNNAVWLDVDLVCGQCHDGAKSGVPAFSRDGMATAAANIHGGSQSATDCTACHTAGISPSAVYHQTGAGTPGTGSGACRTCHLAGGATVHQDSSSDPSTMTDAICGQCHGASPTLTVAHYFSSSMIQTLAANVHVSPLPTCTDCHSQTMAPHGSGVGTPDACTSCHKRPGFPTSLGEACGTCHTSGPGMPFTLDQLSAAASPTAHGALQSNMTCTACHTMTINHLTDAGTPGPMTDSASCKTCHLAGGATVHYKTAFNIASGCGQCHWTGAAPFYTEAQLASVADGIHDWAGVSYPATFTASVVPNSLDVSVNATVNCSGTCPSLEYDWDWGDGTAHGSGNPAVHTYASAGTKTITLTVKLASNHLNVSLVPESITIANPDLPPTASAACVWDANSWTMTVTDNSSDDGPDADTLPGDGNASLQLVIDWGDGSTKSFATGAGAVRSHVYINPGSYTVTDKAIDSILQTSIYTCPTKATPAYFTISGTVYKHDGITPVASATVQVKKGTAIIMALTTAANGTFTTGATLKPGTYSLTATKSGYNFGTAPQISSITVGPVSSGNVIRAVTP